MLLEKRLRTYNQNPGIYINFTAMKEDLVRISAMEFKQVWSNLFNLPNVENYIQKYELACPYGMQDEARAIFPGKYQ